MLHLFVGFIHVVVCFAIIFFVLIQNTKGMGLSGAFGAAGGSDSIFAASGGFNILIKITIVLALIFAITSLTLSFVPPSNPSGGIMAELQGQSMGSGVTIGDLMGGGEGAQPGTGEQLPAGGEMQPSDQAGEESLPESVNQGAPDIQSPPIQAPAEGETNQ